MQKSLKPPPCVIFRHHHLDPKAKRQKGCKKPSGFLEGLFQLGAKTIRKDTPPKTNISPETCWLEEHFPLWNGPFSGDMLGFFWGSSGHTQRFLWGCCQQIFAKQNPRPAPWRVSGSQWELDSWQLQNDTCLATNTVALSAAGSFPHANSRIYLVKSRFWATAFKSIGVLEIFSFDVNVSPTPWEQKRTSFSILRSPSLHLWPLKERFVSNSASA